jgi:hypothetical protein
MLASKAPYVGFFVLINDCDPSFAIELERCKITQQLARQHSGGHSGLGDLGPML